MLHAVFFDLDDTLVDQQKAASTAAIAWAADHGVTDQGVSRRWASISEANYERYSRRELTFDEQRRERVREFLNAEVDDREADELFSGYLIKYEARWVSFDDAVPALGRAKEAGLTVAVLTNGDENHQRMKLQKLGLTDAVDVLVASSMLPAGKPDPRAFSHALEIVGVGADAALMVGDSLEKDVRGALEAGLDAVLLDRDGAHSVADVRRIRSLDELIFAAPGGSSILS
ncbi:HAD family hydrolase [Nocardioides sp.]|uniref:HAD family hydrolase n=1 Tax=Nocardioides sp. TaxID=35761 RepID=UPI002C2D6638|nr:HAD family hydrolase [Nocardioides sp.]HXH79945.1 HAD family hydrolase [Nocardioides sp.]